MGANNAGNEKSFFASRCVKFVSQHPCWEYRRTRYYKIKGNCLFNGYIHAHTHQYICICIYLYTCINVRDSRRSPDKPSSWVVYVILIRVTIFLIPTALFSATRYLSRDPFVCLSVHRCIYLSILSPRPFIPLRSLTCLWSLQVLSFTPLSLFWNFCFSFTISWARIIFI